MTWNTNQTFCFMVCGMGIQKMRYSLEDDGAYRFTICSPTIAKAIEVAEFMQFSVRQWNWCPTKDDSVTIKDNTPWEGYRQ